MKKQFMSSMGVLLLIAASAVAQDVRYNFDKGADFSQFRTYKWVAIKDAKTPDDLVDKQIKSAIDAELTKKGLTRVDTDDANLYVGYQTAIGKEKEFTSYNSSWGYGGGWYGGGWYGGGPSGGMTTGQTTTIYVGQLALDMYDSKKHDLVWRGVASKTLDVKAKPEKRQKNLEKGVRKLLKNFPPPTEKK